MERLAMARIRCTRWRFGALLVVLGSLVVGAGCGPANAGPSSAAGSGALEVGLASSGLASSGPRSGATVALSIAVSGNHFVNGAGATIRLLGVDVPSTEYACEQGWGDAGDPLTTATAAPIAAWHADAVRVPLNEDCWLGINNEPAFGSVGGYRSAIEGWVRALNAEGIYAILDLHWTAPGTNVADGQRPMPDDHSVAFWQSVATSFKSNPAVLFDAFNEPYSPAANGNSALGVSWSCWEAGGCQLPVANQDGDVNDSVVYTAVGMQALVSAIRDTGAGQPILLGGLSYANDLSGWLSHEPTDPDHQLVASLHAYDGNACADVACWNAEVAPVAAKVPVVTGEFDQGSDCTSTPPATDDGYDNTFMNWADDHGVSYVAWGWWVLEQGTSPSCGNDGGDTYDLISDLDGMPIAPDGTDLRAHLAALASVSTPPSTSTTVAVGAGPVAPVAAIPWSALGGCHLLPRRHGETTSAWLIRSGCGTHAVP